MPNDHDTNLTGQAATSCVPCGLHRPVRNVYFDGKMMTARDLTAEQDYMNGMRHLGNMMLEGKGTVCGLKVLQHPQPGCRNSHLVLKAGIALSCCGQEIVVPQDVTIPVLDLIRADPELQLQLVEGMDLVVSLCRQDNPAEMAPVLISDCCSGSGSQMPGRISEDFGFQLSAVPAGTTPLERSVIKPDMKWVHSINGDGQVPTAVSVDEDAGRVWISSGLQGDVALRSYSVATHSQEATLRGWDAVYDIATPSAGAWMFVAGRWNEKDVIALYRRDPAHQARPSGFLFTAGRAQIAVSPITGALFALALTHGARKPSLSAWTAEQLDPSKLDEANMQWKTSSGGDPKVVIQNSNTPLTMAFEAGCRAIAVSPNGQTLALVIPGVVASNPIHIVAVNELLSGGVTKFTDTKADIRGGNNANVNPVFGAMTALQFSYDSSLLHVIGRNSADPADPSLGAYHRISLTESGPRMTGRGMTIALPADAASWPALYVAPDERWVYVSDAKPEDAGGSDDGVLMVFPTAPAKVPAETPDEVNPLQSLQLNTRLSAGVMRLRGQRLYLPGYELIERDLGLDEAATPQGRVLIIDISEADISGLFEAAVEGCSTCGDACSCVTLAHITGYQFVDEAPMAISDAGDASAGSAVIDNLSFRPLVPSNVTLMEAILEIAARGIESGPPGARGENGAQGPAGRAGAKGDNGQGISEVVYSKDVSEPKLEEIGGTGGKLRLLLPEPKAGARGKSIVDVVFGSGTTPRLDPVGNDWRLVLPFPEAGGGGDVRPSNEYQFVTEMGWQHGETFGLDAPPDSMRFTLSNSVANPEALITDQGFGQWKHYFSGALEFRVHTHFDVNDGENPLMISQSNTFQYSPRLESVDQMFDGQTFTIDMKPLWSALRVMKVVRARVEVVLHGSFLESANKFPFCGRPDLDPNSLDAGLVGGTWRSWIEIQSKT